MEYKVGDRVRIKDLDWYNKNKDKDGRVACGYHTFTEKMSKFCGQTMIVCKRTSIGVMTMGGNAYYWTDEMIEGLVEDESKKEVIAWLPNGKLVAEKFNDGTITTIIDKFKYNKLPINSEFFDDKVELVISPDFELKKEGDKWFAIKKKKEYPKTYEECIGKLPINWDGKVEGYKCDLLAAFQKLLICRDVYWKIYGEQIGLGKPWEPDWEGEGWYVIVNHRGDIVTDIQWHANAILAFPTEEMRDAFKENFDPDIEICKELL